MRGPYPFRDVKWAAPCALGVFETMASKLPKNEDSIPARVQVSEVICRRCAEDIQVLTFV